MVDFITPILSQYPQIAVFLSIIGALRLLVKPLVSAIKIVTDATSSKRDDEAVEAVFQSKAWRSLLYVLDWLTSIKTK